MDDAANPDHPHAVWINYTNHRGDFRCRCIIPGQLRWASTEWHPGPQWLLDAIDVTPEEVSGMPPKGARTFAMKDICDWLPEDFDRRITQEIPEPGTDG